MIETVRIMIDFNEQKYEALAKKLDDKRINDAKAVLEKDAAVMEKLG